MLDLLTGNTTSYRWQGTDLNVRKASDRPQLLVYMSIKSCLKELKTLGVSILNVKEAQT